MVRFDFNLASSTSSSIYSVIPLIRECFNLASTGSLRHSSSTINFFPSSPFTLSANSTRASVAFGFLFNNTSSTASSKSFGICSYTSIIPAFTIPISRPALTAWYKNEECMASRTLLFPLNENETLLIPPFIRAYGKLSLIHFAVLMKSTA